MGIVNWSDLATGDFASIDKKKTIVIMPIGSMEQHGPHLPVATDALCVDATIEKLKSADLKVDALLLPTLWCSKSNEHFNFPGTIYLRRETFTQVLEDIAASIARAGFRKLVIINWHGGNIDLLSCMARDIRQQFDIWTFIIDGGRMLSAFKPEWTEPHHYNIHAERYETSIMLASNPQLVKSEIEWGKGSDFGHGKMASMFSGYKHLVPEGGKVLMGWVTTDLTDDGVVGDPTGSNEVEGQQYLDAIVSQISEILPEIASFD